MRYSYQKNRRESTFERNVKKRQRKTKTIQIKMLGSSPFIKTSPAWKTKKPRWAGITVNYEMGAKLFKTETLYQKFKSIELNKIHLYFTMFQKFRWTVKFRGKTRPFNVLEWIKVLFSIPSIYKFKNKQFFSAGNSTHVNYGQRGNWNLMEGLYIAVCNNCFVFNTSIPKPSPSTVFWVGLVLYSLIRCFTLEQWH